MSTTTARRAAAAAGLALGLGALLFGAYPAAAHVTADKTEVPAGGFTAVTLTVPHGCEGSPTRQLDIQVPESILDVTPGIVAGWDVSVATEPLDEPVENDFGETLTQRERVVTYTAQAGNELPDGFRLGFTIGFQAPDTAGEVLLFKSIQRCAEGQTEWIEEWDGIGEEPAHPAPFVTVTDADGDGPVDGGDSSADDSAADDSSADDSSADDSSPSGLAVAGLVTGVLGLATGGTALVSTRKTARS